MADPVLGVVVAHGGLANGLIDAVVKISGVEPDALVAVSNEGRGPEELRDILTAAIGGRPAIVFTDLAAGSCTLAARLTCRDCVDIPVITGVNLPMLLDFVFHRDRTPLELADRLGATARDGVRVILPTRSGDADPAAAR